MRPFLKPSILLFASLVAPSAARAGMRMTLVAIDAKVLAEAQKNPKKVDEILEAEGTKSLDIDKAWHGIHYLLAGNAWEPTPGLGQLILGGKELGGDQGYGPAHYFSAEEVKALAALLQTETPEKLASRYKPEALQKAEIYPDIWVRDGKEGLDYLLEYYRKVVAFYLEAAKHNQAMLFVIN